MAGVASLAEAVGTIPDGAHIALGGFAITRNVIAVVHELIRTGCRSLTLTQVIGGMDTDLLVGAGCVDHLTYSGGSLDRFGFLFAVNRAVLDGTVEAAEYSSLALTLRLHAGALGMPFASCKSMLGSDLLEPLLASGAARVVDDPFTGSPAVALAPIRPDVAIVHADIADETGNAFIGGPTWTMRETAFASSRTIVTAEQVVPAGGIPPDHVSIPAAIVSHVVAVPHGAHPTAVYAHHDYDRQHLEEYAASARTGPEGFAGYLERYVLGTADHAEYLKLVGVTL